MSPRTVRVGDEVTLTELDVSGDPAPPLFQTRHIDWGDGTKENGGGMRAWKPHKYAEPGTYAVTAVLSTLEGENAGVFPDGNTVTVVAAGTEPGPSGSSGGTGPGPGGGSGGDGGGLPVTGPTIGVAAGAGLALSLAGAAAFWAARRRRITFTTGD